MYNVPMDNGSEEDPYWSSFRIDPVMSVSVMTVPRHSIHSKTFLGNRMWSCFMESVLAQSQSSMLVYFSTNSSLLFLGPSY